MDGFKFRPSLFILAISIPYLLILSIDLASSCNEAVCASIVSKCTLTKSCGECELNNGTCYRECFSCLSYLYSECCSCVELCAKPNSTYQQAMQSQVGDLTEEMPELFVLLTEGEDSQGRWAAMTYPVDYDQSWFKPASPESPSKGVFTVADGKITVDPNKEIITVNCTVAYMSQCMPMNKCKNSCHSMGASYYRWFHDGCCECVGKTCTHYGVNESRCSACSLEDDGKVEEEEEVSTAGDTEKDEEEVEKEKEKEEET